MKIKKSQKIIKQLKNNILKYDPNSKIDNLILRNLKVKYKICIIRKDFTIIYRLGLNNRLNKNFIEKNNILKRFGIR